MNRVYNRCYGCRVVMKDFVRWIFVDKSVKYQKELMGMGKFGGRASVPSVFCHEEMRRTYTFQKFCLNPDCLRSVREEDIFPEWQLYVKAPRSSPKNSIIIDMNLKVEELNTINKNELFSQVKSEAGGLSGTPRQIEREEERIPNVGERQADGRKSPHEEAREAQGTLPVGNKGLGAVRAGGIEREEASETREVRKAQRA